MGVNLLPHNKETYDRMIEMFKTDKRVGVVQPTGTGKSFLMLKWIEDHINENIIVISPSNVLFTQLHRYAKECDLDISHVEMHTYQKLDRADHSSIEMINADKIILDEFHRTGAEKWGESIDILLDSHSNAQVLGLTATPIRYLDRSKDMADEIFNNNLARCMTLGEAIESEILPIPKYIPVWYDYNNKLTRYQKDINSIKNTKEREECERLLRELKRNLQNSYGAEDIFKDNMPHDHGKYIVFCIDNNHLKKMKKKMLKWLKGINTNIHNYITVSERSDRDDQVQQFIDDNDPTSIKLLFSINRLNEGLHVEGIDGVIMLRPTDSGIVYLQQMGRAFATDNETPIIFDMVNNYQNVKVQDPDSPEDGYQNILERQFGFSLLKKRIISNRSFGIFEDFKKFNEIFEYIESILYPDYDQKWNENFELLKEFKEKYNRDPKISDIYNGVNIGQWLRMQRRNLKLNTLSKERQEKLESIGIDLSTRPIKSWDESFEILKDFIAEYDREPKQIEEYKDFRIGLWLTAQKSLFKNGNLSKERQEKLESIGIIIERSTQKSWDEYFELVKEFIEAYNKEPKQAEVYKGQNIGTWISNQRRDFKYNELSKEKQKKLQSIGLKLKRKRTQKSWNENFEIVKEFIESYDLKQIDTSFEYKEVKIKPWINTQKTNFKDGKLSKERQEKLESIGITLKIMTWDDKFELVKEFKEKYGKDPKISDVYKDENIGIWISTQRNKFRDGTLSKEQQEKLESINIKININRKTISWDDKFELLKEFRSNYGRDPRRGELYKEVNIGNWLTSTVKNEFSKGKLSKEQQEKLESIGANFKRIKNKDKE